MSVISISDIPEEHVRTHQFYLWTLTHNLDQQSLMVKNYIQYSYSDYTISCNYPYTLFKNNQPIQTYKDKEGYVHYQTPSIWNSRLFCYENQHKDFDRVHRTIALHLIPQPKGQDKYIIDHVDRLRSNNSICNLRWYTTRENNNNRENSLNPPDDSFLTFSQIEQKYDVDELFQLTYYNNGSILDNYFADTKHDNIFVSHHKNVGYFRYCSEYNDIPPEKFIL